MRENKFRVWDKVKRQMYDVWQIQYKSSGEMTVRVYDVELKSPNTKHRLLVEFTLIQFTGLLDKSGVEIYEGDILYWDGSIIGAVSFEYAEFICGVGINARNLCSAPINDIAVIGNIHENPEFLEAKS